MLKKSLVVVAGLVLLGGLLFGRDAFSYLGTTLSQVRQSAKDMMPIELEFKRAQGMISGLDGEIRRNHRVIAQQELEVEKLARQVATQRDALAEMKSRITQRYADVKSGASHYVYAGRTFSSDQVKRDLERRFSAFQVRENTLNKLEQILSARETSLMAAKEKVESMLVQRSQLEVALADLQARQQLVEVHQANSEFNLDDSHLARTRELMDDIENRIAVDEKMSNLDEHYDAEVPFDDESKDIIEDVGTSL